MFYRETDVYKRQIEEFYDEPYTDSQIETIFAKAMRGQQLSALEIQMCIRDRYTVTSSEETQRLQKLCIHDRIYRNMHLFHLVMHVTLGSVSYTHLDVYKRQQ